MKHFKTFWHFHINFNIILPFGPSNSTPEHLLKKKKQKQKRIYMSTQMYTTIFVAALTQKQSKYESTGE